MTLDAPRSIFTIVYALWHTPWRRSPVRGVYARSLRYHSRREGRVRRARAAPRVAYLSLKMRLFLTIMEITINWLLQLSCAYRWAAHRHGYIRSTYNPKQPKTGITRYLFAAYLRTTFIRYLLILLTGSIWRWLGNLYTASCFKFSDIKCSTCALVKTAR